MKSTRNILFKLNNFYSKLISLPDKKKSYIQSDLANIVNRGYGIAYTPKIIYIYRYFIDSIF